MSTTTHVPSAAAELSLHVTAQGEGEHQRLAIQGEATIYNAADLKDRLLVPLCAARQLDLDLSGITEIDTAGLQVLILCRREADQAKKTLRITAASPRLSALLSLYGLSGILDAEGRS